MRRRQTVESMRTDSLTPISLLGAQPPTPWRIPPNLIIPDVSPAVTSTPDLTGTNATTPDPLRSKSPLALPSSYNNNNRDSLSPSVEPTPVAKDDDSSSLSFPSANNTDPFLRTYLHAEYGRSSLAKRQVTTGANDQRTYRPIGRLQPVYLANVTAVQRIGDFSGGMSSVHGDSSKATSVFEAPLSLIKQRISFAGDKVPTTAERSANSPGGDSKSESTKSSQQTPQPHAIQLAGVMMEETHRTLIRPRGWSIAGKPQPMPTPELLVQRATGPESGTKEYGYLPPWERRALSLALVPGATALSTQATLAPTDAGGAMHFKAIRQRMRVVEEEANRAADAVIVDSKRKLQAVEDALKRRVVTEANNSVPVERPRPSLALIAELQRRGTLGGMGSSPAGIRRRTLVPQDSYDVARDAGLIALISATAGDDSTEPSAPALPAAVGGGGSRRSTAHTTSGRASSPRGTPAILLTGASEATLKRNDSVAAAKSTSPMRHRIMSTATALDTLAQVRANADAANRRAQQQRDFDDDHPGAAVTIRLFRARDIELLELEEERARQVLWREEANFFRAVIQAPFDEYHVVALKLVDAILEHQHVYGSLYLPWTVASTATGPTTFSTSQLFTASAMSSVATTALNVSQPSMSPSNPSLMSSTLHTFGLRGRSDSRIVALREAVQHLQDGTAADVGFGDFGAFANSPFGSYGGGGGHRPARARVANVVSPKSMLVFNNKAAALEQWKEDAAKLEPQADASPRPAPAVSRVSSPPPPVALVPFAHVHGSSGSRATSDPTETETNDDAVSMRSGDSLNMGDGDDDDDSAGTQSPQPMMLRSAEEQPANGEGLSDLKTLLTKSLSSFTAFDDDAAPSPVMSSKKRSSRKSFAASDRERRRFLREVEELRSVGRLDALLVNVFKKITQQREIIPSLV